MRICITLDDNLIKIHFFLSYKHAWLNFTKKNLKLWISKHGYLLRQKYMSFIKKIKRCTLDKKIAYIFFVEAQNQINKMSLNLLLPPFH
jgi:hypothetical protein